MNVWRVKLNPDSAPGINGPSFCIERNIVGIGWAIDGTPKNKEEYLSLSKIKHKNSLGWRRATSDFISRMEIGDLVWARKRAEYYLGRIESDWEYRGAYEYLNTDAVNVRKCPWLSVPTLGHVPGKISASFRAGSTVQRVIQGSAITYSKYLYNQLAKREEYGLDLSPEADIFSLLSDEDLEDLVGLYLQWKHKYLFQPSSCKRDTPLVEFELVSQDGKIKASASVKSGETPIDMSEFATRTDQVYLFAACERYLGKGKENLMPIPKADLRQFLRDHEAVLPERIRLWIKYVKQMRKVESL